MPCKNPESCYQGTTFIRFPKTSPMARELQPCGQSDASPILSGVRFDDHCSALNMLNRVFEAASCRVSPTGTDGWEQLPDLILSKISKIMGCHRRCTSGLW